MNGDNQSQQEQHRLAERVAHLETAIEYQAKALPELREEMRAGFARVDAGFVHADARVDAGFAHVDNAFVRANARMDAGFSRADTRMDEGFARADARMDEGFARADARMDAGFARADARMDAGFARVDAEFIRVHEQLTRIRTTDFRILLSISLTTALGTIGLVVKVFGLL